MSIKIKVAELHKQQIENVEVQKELESIQNYFDSETLELTDDTINFVFVKGDYNHIKRTMVVIGIYINNTIKRISGIESTLRLRFKNLDAHLAVVSGFYPPEFLGVLEPKEGVLLHLEIPVKGLKEDRVFTVKEIEGHLENIKLLISDINH